jgi:hypothetical protein
MTTTQWIISIIVALIGGGAMGAVITAVLSKYRNRRQPVAYTLEVIDIFRKGKNFPRLAKLLVTEHPLGYGEERSVDNLSLARITVTNKGNQDIKEFSFGVTMDEGNKTVDTRFSGTDRHHLIKIGFPGLELDKEPKEPVTAIDFFMEPFNRGDTYSVDIYFTYDKNRGEVKLSSSHPIQFVKLSEPKLPSIKVLIWFLALTVISVLFLMIVQLIDLSYRIGGK